MSILYEIVAERKKLEQTVAVFGLGSEISLAQSQKLDKLIVAHMLEQRYNKQQG
ncbi:aspartyl-phosphate phosphatase Spo0E family protein [Dethiobacter alkaliphilus]|uniref:Spo0E like sporulation regulatory protein n=1 Tax=Dethiobacter alkaliphilus AHT 1 TaxID=555088 RepID=C0GHG8_DETAL|nr:aspartyl-phosphate phosphatase Spo0E family protein [Dethiobacter alkaliphilus]EEG77174.1 hypothetical protein DealDRAFT_1927 [Dethiobacter alkaliphilus AHT 1]